MEAAGRLGTYPGGRVIVEGHTDNVESEAYNLRLSEQRAAVVLQYYCSRTRQPRASASRASATGTRVLYHRTRRNKAGNGTEESRFA